MPPSSTGSSAGSSEFEIFCIFPFAHSGTNSFKCAYKVGAAVITFFSVRHMKAAPYLVTDGVRSTARAAFCIEELIPAASYIRPLELTDLKPLSGRYSRPDCQFSQWRPSNNPSLSHSRLASATNKVDPGWLRTWYCHVFSLSITGKRLAQFLLSSEYLPSWVPWRTVAARTKLTRPKPYRR